MKILRLIVVTSIAGALLVAQPRAQSSSTSLTLGLFERYLDALRLEFGVPSLTAIVLEDGRTWERSFGLADVSANVAATPSTPYPITGLTQTIGATLVLLDCVQSGRGRLSDRVLRWTPFAEPNTTIGQLLTHLDSTGHYRFDPGRYSTLSEVAAECVNNDFEKVLAETMDRLRMYDSVPGRDVLQSPLNRFYTSSQLDRYSAALRRLAVPYKLDSKHTATRSDYTASGVSASTGVISTARDLATFDAGLTDLLSSELLTQSWNAPPDRPTGLGWFVQSYGGQSGDQRVVWQFGIAPDAYSSLIVKIPDRRLTLILLANSDSLSNTINPQSPDVTQSIFARTFLRLYVN